MTAERTPHELRAASRLVFEEGRRAAGGVGQVHLAIADRAFRASGPGARPAHATHDAIARAVYGALGAGAGVLGRAAGEAAERLAPRNARALSTTPRGAAVLAALNGLIGDELERHGSELQEPMAVRLDGRVVDPSPEAIAAAFPGATRRLVVFLPGLMESEHVWRLGGRESYGSRLARDLGTTAIDVRYNSGRHISENGAALAALLEQIVAGWPTDVEQIALVGHSMGGLVARSACHAGGAWTRRVRHVVSLGTPHMGASLVGGVHWLSAALGVLPETRAFSGLLRRRSAGIRDLRQGSLVDEDWRGRDPEALRAAACDEVPLLDGAMHCFVAAAITRDASHPLGRLIGDALVLAPSASGRSRTRRLAFREEDGLALGGTHHLALLNHPDVYAALRRWLATGPGRGARDGRPDGEGT